MPAHIRGALANMAKWPRVGVRLFGVGRAAGDDGGVSGKREARQPREWALEPRDFGVNPRIRWHPPARGDAFEEICLRAAEIQHEVLLVANAHRKSRGDVAWSEIAGEFEMGYDQLLKVVRGQAHMSLRHAADFARVLGPVLMTEYRRMLLAKESDD